MITITIVFHWTTAIIGNIFKWPRHNQLHAEAEHIGNVGRLVRYHFLVYLNRSLVIDGISDIQFSRNLFHLIFCWNNRLIVYNVIFQWYEFDIRILPCIIFQLQFCSIIIVGRCPPEIRGKCGTVFNHVQTVDNVFIHIAGRSLESDKEVLTFYNPVADIRIVYLRCNYGDIVFSNILQLHFRSFVWM